MISADSATRDGETDAQRDAREGTKADCARHRAEADSTTTAANANLGAADGGGTAHNQGGHRVIHNLNEESIQVDGHEVQPTLSANLAVTMNELGRLASSPVLAKATAMLKAAKV